MISLPVPLPQGYTPIVAVSERVIAGQTIAQLKGNNEEFVNVPEYLGVPLTKVNKYIKKNPGDRIQPGDIIAIRKNIFGKTKAAIISEVSGTILRYERNTGNLVVTTGETVNKGDVISPVDGMVELCNNKEIVIHTGNAIIGTKAITGVQSEGQLYVLKASFTDTAPKSILFFLDHVVSKKIVFANIITRDVILKGITIGAVGFIAREIPESDRAFLKEKNISVPIIEVGEESVAVLKKLDGKKVVIDPQTITIFF